MFYGRIGCKGEGEEGHIRRIFDSNYLELVNNVTLLYLFISFIQYVNFYVNPTDNGSKGC